jgi:uncharacterized Fe-S cluster-containing radical SAM superfamily enzyme
MSEDVFSRILEDKARTEAIVVGGVGEPTSHPRFAEYSKRLALSAVNANDNLELTSNAYQWDENTLKTMVEHYKKVTVSVDGLPPSFFEARGFEFDIMAENVQRLIEARKAAGVKTPIIHAMLVLSKDNINDVRELISPC